MIRSGLLARAKVMVGDIVPIHHRSVVHGELPHAYPTEPGLSQRILYEPGVGMPSSEAELPMMAILIPG